MSRLRPEWLTEETVALLGNGMRVTLVLTVLTTIAASALAIGMVLLRSSPSRPARRVAAVYIEVFRNVPALIQIIFWAFAFPSMFSPELRRQIFFDNTIINGLGSLSGLTVPYYGFAACLGLVLNSSAHGAEILRAGISSIPATRLEAARTLGASHRTAFFRVALPDGTRAVFPALTTRIIHNMKNTALASFVAVPELFHQMQASINRTFQATNYLLATAALYLTLASIMSTLLGRVDRRLNRSRG